MLKEEERISTLEWQQFWQQTLIETLGNPSEWKFEGEVIDAGEGALQSIDPPRCACGHPIRWIFVIEHPTKGKSQVGSTCIKYFQNVNPETFNELQIALNKLIEKINIQKNSVEEIRKQKEIQKLEFEYYEFIKKIKDKEIEYRKKTSMKNDQYHIHYGISYTLGMVIDSLILEVPKNIVEKGIILDFLGKIIKN